MNPSKTLRKLAGVAIRLAKDFEDQHNQQNNNLGVVVALVEEELEKKIADLVERVTAIEQEIREQRGVNGASG